LSAPYLENTHFGLPTEILIFLGIQHSAVSTHFLIPQCTVSTLIFKSHVKLYSSPNTELWIWKLV
jgi:hypothetical protein